MINKIKIKNCGCITQFQTQLNKINIFYGPDSSGKSTILESIYNATNPHIQITNTLSDFVAATEHFAAIEITKNHTQLKVLIYPHKTTHFINEKTVDFQTVLEFNNVFFIKLDPENFFSSATQQKWLFDKLCKQIPNCYSTLMIQVNQIKNLLQKYQKPTCPPIQKQQILKQLDNIRQVCQIWFTKMQTMLLKIEKIFSELHHSIFTHEPTIKIQIKPWIELHTLTTEITSEQLVENFQAAINDPIKTIGLFVGLGIDFKAQTNFLEAFSLRKKIVYLLLLDMAFIHLFEAQHKKDVIILIDNFDFLNDKIQNFFLSSAFKLGQVLITKETTSTPLKIPNNLEAFTTVFHSPFHN